MSPRPSARPAAKSTAHADQQQPARGQWAYVVLFVLLALIAAQTARLGIAGFYVQLGRNETEQWTPESRAPSARNVERVARHYSDSLKYVSDNPWALEGAGAMDLEKMRASKIPREALAATRDANLRFRQALRQRPTSPYLWANLALSKLYLDQIDGELSAALRHAEELGPWEQSIQQTVVFVGLAAWQDLGPDARQAVPRTIRRGAERNPQKIFQIVKSYTRFDLVCAIEEYRRIGGADCAKAAQTARPGEAANQGIPQ